MFLKRFLVNSLLNGINVVSLFFSNNYCTEGDKIEVVKESLRWVIVAFCVAPPPPGGE